MVEGPTATLGVRRLAITDIAHGHQPLSASEGGAVGFNGAIYNARALSARLGLEPATGNDGEVLWPLYRRHGLRFADHLDGMFAVCIVDEISQRVVLAVDQLGIKPLFLATGTHGWFAASTLDALPGELREVAFRVPAGTVVASTGEVESIVPLTAVDAPLADLLAVSVREQAPAEVPWGCLLSGGVDSSTVTALAAREYGRIPAYTSGLPGSSDLAAAAWVASVIGVEHRIEPINEAELPVLIDECVRVTATPDVFTVLGGVGTYVAARAAARDGIKVLLSGEGADELFAGYDDYRSTPRELLDSCLESDQRDLGATECLRLDRCTMAHGIEARVPFLSASVIAHARRLPGNEKIAWDGPEPVHKVAVRRVARDVLPEAIARRPKVGFPDGAGLGAAAVRLAQRCVSDRELNHLRSGAGTYFEVQRGLGIDERLAALTLARWLHYHDLGPWDELVKRGLVRRGMSDGEYAPFSCATESAIL